MGIRLFKCELGQGGIGLMNIEDIKKKLKHDLLYEVKDFYTQINTVCDKYSLLYDNLDFDSIINKKELNVIDKIR